MKMLLQENYEGIFALDESKKDKDILGTTTVPFIETDKKNLNGRVYPTRVMKNEISRLKERLADQKYLWGAPSHPESGAHEIKIGEISHRISDIFFDEKTKRAVAKIDVLNTRAGKDLAVILNHGKIYVSARGSGTTHPGADQSEEVDDSYRLHGLDFTLTPSFDFGGVSLQENLFESAEFPADEEDEGLEREIGEVEEEGDLEEEFSSLRGALEDVIRAEFDPDSWVKDFSATEVVVQKVERDPVTGATTDVLLRMPYEIDLKTDEIIIDFNSAEVVKSAVDYVPEEKFNEAKFGLLSEQEMRITGAKQFGKSRTVKLSEEEMKYISPKLAAILRDEKFPKK
jgi:hypothetical protein